MSKKKVGIIALIIIIIAAVVMVFAYGIKNKQVVVSEDDKMKIVVTSFLNMTLQELLLVIRQIYKCL